MDKITQILQNVVRCKYFEAGVHIKNPIERVEEMSAPEHSRTGGAAQSTQPPNTRRPGKQLHQTYTNAAKTQRVQPTNTRSPGKRIQQPKHYTDAVEERHQTHNPTSATFSTHKPRLGAATHTQRVTTYNTVAARRHIQHCNNERIYTKAKQRTHQRGALHNKTEARRYTQRHPGSPSSRSSPTAGPKVLLLLIQWVLISTTLMCTYTHLTALPQIHPQSYLHYSITLPSLPHKCSLCLAASSTDLLPLATNTPQQFMQQMPPTPHPSRNTTISIKKLYLPPNKHTH